MARILIVDDSKTSRKFLRNMLEQAGHEIVAEAVDGCPKEKNSPLLPLCAIIEPEKRGSVWQWNTRRNN